MQMINYMLYLNTRYKDIFASSLRMILIKWNIPILHRKIPWMDHNGASLICSLYASDLQQKSTLVEVLSLFEQNNIVQKLKNMALQLVIFELLIKI